MIGFPVARLALLIVVLAVGVCASSRAARRPRRRRRRRRRAREGNRGGRPVVLSSAFIASPPRQISARRSRRQRESFRFDIHEHAAERADAPVEVGRFGAFQIGEEAARPRAPCASRRICCSVLRRRERPPAKARHDLAQGRGVILRLGLPSARSMPSAREIVAQPRERPLVQKAGQIVGRIGQQLAAAEPDEEIEIFALDALDVDARLPASASAACATPSGRRIAAQPRQSR